MRKTDPRFQMNAKKATHWLMDEFLCWNATQEELASKGFESNWYNDREVAQERRFFQAIAERFVLEGIDWHDWQWFETPWAGTDGNTGHDARVIDFCLRDSTNAGLGVLAFYVARNDRFWFATPLADTPWIGGTTATFEVNAIQDAIDALNLLDPAGENAKPAAIPA